MTKTLLEKAREVKPSNRRLKISDEQIELAIAWMTDEIGYTQICKTLGWKTSGNYRATLSTWMREGYRRGKIIVK